MMMMMMMMTIYRIVDTENPPYRSSDLPIELLRYCRSDEATYKKNQRKICGSLLKQQATNRDVEENHQIQFDGQIRLDYGWDLVWLSWVSDALLPASISRRNLMCVNFKYSSRLRVANMISHLSGYCITWRIQRSSHSLISRWIQVSTRRRSCCHNNPVSRKPIQNIFRTKLVLPQFHNQRNILVFYMTRYSHNMI